ncbi:response regulator [Phenylobacterium sp.]|uniref:response regulator n=1 Tax=Phenylobacterium sp. TaxID=1871053 RepID=UPI0027304F04|nr:response regulator [Phenylobacterium sp.]MDP1599309.1 response regulator [Phenylobacterium sp.]MDP3595293.1 response regulator [Phenylobacterium sp.]
MSVSLSRVRFLIVDDNTHAVNLVKAMLRGFGADQLYDAQTVDSAQRRMKITPCDIVILDYMLGAEEGVTFARWLRNDPDSPAPYTPIILLTGHADRPKIVAARDAGVNEFCVKPVTPADLMKRIAWVIDRARPFVRSQTYFGPDRRRHDDPNYRGPEQRADRAAKPV